MKSTSIFISEIVKYHHVNFLNSYQGYDKYIKSDEITEDITLPAGTHVIKYDEV